MAEYTNLDVDYDDGVATVALDSTVDRNALRLEMADELVSVVTTLSEDPDTRCIVLTHDGDFFGAGADLSQLSGDRSDAALLRQLAGRAHEAIVQFHQAEKPVIGGVNGIAAGIGFSLALMPDMVVLGDDAMLQFAYPGIGLTGDGGQRSSSLGWSVSERRRRSYSVTNRSVPVRPSRWGSRTKRSRPTSSTTDSTNSRLRWRRDLPRRSERRSAC